MGVIVDLKISNIVNLGATKHVYEVQENYF